MLENYGFEPCLLTVIVLYDVLSLKASPSAEIQRHSVVELCILDGLFSD